MSVLLAFFNIAFRKFKLTYVSCPMYFCWTVIYLTLDKGKASPYYRQEKSKFIKDSEQ